MIGGRMSIHSVVNPVQNNRRREFVFLFYFILAFITIRVWILIADSKDNTLEIVAGVVTFLLLFFFYWQYRRNQRMRSDRALMRASVLAGRGIADGTDEERDARVARNAAELGQLMELHLRLLQSGGYGGAAAAASVGLTSVDGLTLAEINRLDTFIYKRDQHEDALLGACSRASLSDMPTSEGISLEGGDSVLNPILSAALLPSAAAEQGNPSAAFPLPASDFARNRSGSAAVTVETTEAAETAGAVGSAAGEYWSGGGVGQQQAGGGDIELGMSLVSSTTRETLTYPLLAAPGPQSAAAAPAPLEGATGLTEASQQGAPSFSLLPSCSVCLAEYTENESLTRLPCARSHVFHARCISLWLVRHRSCPLCKKNVAALLSGGTGVEGERVRSGMRRVGQSQEQGERQRQRQGVREEGGEREEWDQERESEVSAPPRLSAASASAAAAVEAAVLAGQASRAQEEEENRERERRHALGIADELPSAERSFSQPPPSSSFSSSPSAPAAVSTTGNVEQQGGIEGSDGLRGADTEIGGSSHAQPGLARTVFGRWFFFATPNRSTPPRAAAPLDARFVETGSGGSVGEEAAPAGVWQVEAGTRGRERDRQGIRVIDRAGVIGASAQQGDGLGGGRVADADADSRNAVSANSSQQALLAVAQAVTVIETQQAETETVRCMEEGEEEEEEEEGEVKE